MDNIQIFLRDWSRQKKVSREVRSFELIEDRIRLSISIEITLGSLKWNVIVKGETSYTLNEVECLAQSLDESFMEKYSSSFVEVGF
jgi:hypothetical protein